MDLCEVMAHKLHPKALAWMVAAGKPPVSDEEIVRARELRKTGLSFRAIGKILGRVQSTVFFMLRVPR